ncbi:MAG: tetratricopeptide repeat protein [Candidatus Korobacteraceae bacterium]
MIATVALYYPVHNHPFINYDDRDYVYENAQVKSGISLHTIRWAFTTSAAGNWHPLTWLSHELDCQLFGLDPAGHHDVNVLFHTINAVLLFWVLLRATGFAGRSFMVAALFALHPINVESVAWIAERKNVLSMMFFLLALGAYGWYAKRPRVPRYLLVALLFACGLMAKPQVIIFPCVLLLWDYWPLQRMFQASARRADSTLAVPARNFWWLLVEKLPFFALVAASAIVTLKVQHGSRMFFPRRMRAGNAILSYGLYLWKSVWPERLTLFYPHPELSLDWWKVLFSGLFLLAITVVVILGRRHRYLPVGWFWFLGTLVPMLGIIQVGLQGMADRYAYVSFLGLFMIICWGAAEMSQRFHFPAAVLPSVSVAALLFLAVTARQQIDYWQTDVDVWEHALQVTTGNWLAESQLGTALAIDGRVEEAIPHFRQTLALEPSDANANMGIGIYELRRGNYREAIVYYQRVVTENKASRIGIPVNAWVGMAKAYAALGDAGKAQECLRAAKRLSNESGGMN